MNGRVISVDEWNALDGVKIRTLRRTNVHYGAEVDGICFPLADALTPASTIAMVTADCPTVVIAGYGVTGDARVIVCHCGRDSLHDLENKHAGITAITSIAEWVNTGNILYAGIFAGIGGNSFTHPTCHPRHGEKNQKMRAFFGRYASEGVRELSNYNISFDMPVIVKHLLMRLGVNERVIHLDGVNTATHVPYASFAKGDRGKPQRNIIYVHPFQLFEAVA
jgi:copper oxidase (laccase) domain-containing protein